MERADSPLSPLGPVSLRVKQGVRGSRWSPWVQRPAGLTPCMEARGWGGTLAEVADPRPAALQPCPPPSQRRIWARGKGLSGGLPTLRACCGHSSGTKGACWLCVRSAGPRGHLGSTQSQAGLPQAAFEGWGISSSSQPHAGGLHIWPGRCLPIPTALSSPRAPSLAPLGNQGTKGNACRPAPSDGCPRVLLPGAL